LPFHSKRSLANVPVAKQDRAMTSHQALVRMTLTALRGGTAMHLDGLNNNNRNNASHPRAGD
jgi:hypothetical protein